MTIPPSTAIIAFAVLFGHPILQMVLIGFGVRSFAVTPWGRIATYSSAAVAGVFVAWALHRAPAPPEHPHPEWRTAPDTPTRKVIPRDIGRTGDEEVANLDALKQRVVTDSSKDGSISVGGGEASVILRNQDLNALVVLLDAAQKKSSDRNTGISAEDRSKSVGVDSEQLKQLRNKIETVRQLANLDINFQISLRVGSPGANFATKIDERSGRPIFQEPAKDGEDR